MSKRKHANTKKQTPPSLRLLYGKDIIERSIKWLWLNRIPLGELTVIQGHPGLGKSLLAIDMVARVTTGRAFPFCNGIASVGKGRAIILSAEDNAETTLKPRLAAAEADPTRWAVVESDGFFTLKSDVRWLVQQMEAISDLRLIVIDPISAYYGDGIDENRNAQVRGILRPLVVGANKHSVALLPINHLNKKPGQIPMMRGLGSIGLVAASRVAYLIERDADKAGQHRLMMPVKMNLAKESELDGMAFEVVEAANGHPRIEWWGRVPMTADMAMAVSDNMGEPTAIEEAIAMMEAAVGPRGECSGDEMEEKRKEAGISHASFKRARKLCPHIQYSQPKDEGGKYQSGKWTLIEPESGQDEPAVPVAHSLTLSHEITDLNMCKGGLLPQMSQRGGPEAHGEHDNDEPAVKGSRMALLKRLAASETRRN